MALAFLGCAAPVEGQGYLVSYGTSDEFGCTSYYNPYDANNAHTVTVEFALNGEDPFYQSSGLAAVNAGLRITWEGTTSGLDLTNVPATTPGGSDITSFRIMSACSASFTVTNPDLLAGDFLTTPVEIGEEYVLTGLVFINDTAAVTAIPYNASSTDATGFNKIEHLGAVNVTFPQGLFFNYLQNNPGTGSPGINMYRYSAPGSIGQTFPEWTNGNGENYNMSTYMYSVPPDVLTENSFIEMFSGFDPNSTSFNRNQDLEIKFRNIALINRGTFDNDGASSLSDVMSILFYVLQGVGTPLCEKAIDVNDDGILDISDAVGLLNYLYGSGAAVPFPGPTDACSPDPTPDTLECFENTCI